MSGGPLARQIRLGLHLKQTEVAKKLCISNVTLNRFEHNISCLRVSSLCKLKELYCLDADTMWKIVEGFKDTDSNI